MNTLITAEQLRRSASGGIGTYIRALVRGLVAIDEQPFLFASRAPVMPDPLDALGVRVVTSHFPSKVMTHLWDAGLGRLPSGFDVAHGTAYVAPPTNCPRTVAVHDVAWRTFPDAYPPRGVRWHEAALRRTVQSKARLIVPSSPVADALVNGGVEHSSIEVIAHGSDHLPPPDFDEARTLLRNAGLDDGRPFILAVGTLEPRKNLRRLLEAYESVRTQLPEDMAMVVVGRIGWGDEVEAVEGVFVVDQATDEDISAFYEMCEFVAYVPLLEGFGLPVVEAMAKAAPVVTTNVPAAGNAAYGVDPNDVVAIANALREVASDAALRLELISKGEDHVRDMTWENSAAAHVAVWKDMQ